MCFVSSETCALLNLTVMTHSKGFTCTLTSLLFFSLTPMSLSFRPVKSRHEELRQVLERFRKGGQLETAYRALLSGDWARHYFITKTKHQELTLKEHVSFVHVIRDFGLLKMENGDIRVDVSLCTFDSGQGSKRDACC